jgi:hypothetical protein
VEKAQDKNSHGEADGIVEVICCTNGAQEQGESNKRKERREAGELKEDQVRFGNLLDPYVRLCESELTLQ